MNTIHSVNAPALSGKRSMISRFVTLATAASVLVLGVASASADPGGHGKYKLVGKATGGISVKGEGKFKVRDKEGKLAFDSQIGGCKDINMADGRQKHTCSEEDSKLKGMTKDAMAKLIVEKKDLKFPKAGETSSGDAKGEVHFLGKKSSVTVHYEVTEKGGKYKVKSASFEFDYTKHTNEVCLIAVCVQPKFQVTVEDAEIETSP